MNIKILNIAMIFLIFFFLAGIAGIAFKFLNVASYIVVGVSAMLFLMCLKVKSKTPRK